MLGTNHARMGLAGARCMAHSSSIEKMVLCNPQATAAPPHAGTTGRSKQHFCKGGLNMLKMMFDTCSNIDGNIGGDDPHCAWRPCS